MTNLALSSFDVICTSATPSFLKCRSALTVDVPIPTEVTVYNVFACNVVVVVTPRTERLLVIASMSIIASDVKSLAVVAIPTKFPVKVVPMKLVAVIIPLDE